MLSYWVCTFQLGYLANAVDPQEYIGNSLLAYYYLHMLISLIYVEMALPSFRSFVRSNAMFHIKRNEMYTMKYAKHLM